MIGRRLSAVTLHERGAALTENYVKVEMVRDREPNQIVELEIGGLSDNGLREVFATARGGVTSPGVLPLLSRS